MNKNTLKKGKKAEKVFRDIYSYDIFGINGLLMADETNQLREGEYRLPDGSLVELKSDWRGYDLDRPTGNLPIEFYHSGHENGYGWYEHCQQNDVEHIVFECFRGESKRYPFRIIYIQTQYLVNFISEHGDEYPVKQIQDDGNTVKFWCIPADTIIAECNAVVFESDSPKRWPVLMDFLSREAKESLEQAEIGGQIGEPTIEWCIEDNVCEKKTCDSRVTHLSTDDEQSPENTEDVNETGLERNDDV